MARPDVFDSLNALTGMQGDQAQSDFEQAPLPYETPAMTQGRVAQGQQQRVQYGRMKAEDLASRGIPYDTSGRGNVSEITDATGAPLSNADKTNKIAYDSAGKPVDYSQRDPTTGKHVLTDPYANVPDWTEPTTGNVYRRPKGLPWVQTGTDPAVTQQIQAKVNAQTATALAPVEQQAKTALTQAAKAVKISGAQTKAALQTQGVIVDPNAPDVAKKLDDAFNTEYGSPDANATPFWGGGTRTPEAEALRKQIDARKAAANAALAQHQQVVTSAQQAQAQLDQVRGTREQLQGDKMAELNRRRVAVGLDPINIGGNQAVPSVADVQQQGATLDAPATPTPSTAAPESSPAPTVAAAQPSNPTQSPPAVAPTVDLSSVAQQPDAAIQTQAAAATQKSLAALPAPPKPGAPDFWDTNAPDSQSAIQANQKLQSLPIGTPAGKQYSIMVGPDGVKDIEVDAGGPNHAVAAQQAFDDGLITQHELQVSRGLAHDIQPESGVPRYETDPHFGEDKPLNLVDKPNPNALSWSAVQAESADPIGLEHAKEVYPIVKATAEAPLIDLPKPENKGVVSGIARGAESTVEGMATLENALAGMGIGAASPIVQKLAAGGFSAMMLKNAVDTIGDASHAPTAGERAEGYTQAVLQLLLGALSGKHAFGRDRATGGAAAAAEPNSEPFQRTFNEPPEEPQGPAGLGPSPNEPTPPSQPSPNAPDLALPQPPVSEPVSPAANEPATGNELALRQSELASMAPNDPMRPLVELQVKQLTNRETAPDSTETAALAQEPSAESQLQTEQRPSVIADESQVPAPVPEGTAQPPEEQPSAQGPVGEVGQVGEDVSPATSEQPPQPPSTEDKLTDTSERKSSSAEITPTEEPAQEPTPKAEKPVASPTKSAEVLPPAAKSLPDVATLKPHEVLNDAKNVKLTTPKGARFLRVTDSKGRQIVEPLENVTKGANVFHQAGPFKRVESGVLNSKKQFVPLKGEITATDANKPSEPASVPEKAPAVSEAGGSKAVQPSKLPTEGKQGDQSNGLGKEPASQNPAISPEGRQVQKLANAALALHKDSLTALGHPHAFETGETRAGSGIETDVQSQRIRIDPEKLAKATAKMTPAVRAEFVKRAVAQEVIHVGTLKYAAESAANRQKLLGLNDDEELMKRAADAYGPEWKDQSDFAKAAEAARMLLEGPEKLTEASYKFLKDFLEWMKSKLKNLSKDAREVLDGIRQKLGTYEKEKAPSKQAPPKDESTVSTETKKKGISDALQRMIQRQMDEAKGREIIEDMVDNGESPKDVAKKFWDDTYDSLNDVQQRRFQKMIKNVTGMEPGDVIATKPGEGGNVESIIGKNWSEIFGEADLPDSAEHLEGTERGLIVLMKAANEGAGQMKSANASEAGPMKQLQGKEAEKPATPADIRAEITKLKADGDPEGLVPGLERYLAKKENPVKELAAATPDSTPGPAGEEAPSGKQPSESQPDRPSTEAALATGEDSVAARNEKLMEEAEAAGLSPSLETIKGILRADPKAMDKLRAMIKGRTGKDAINAATPEAFGASNPLKSMRDTYDSVADALTARASKKEIAYKQDAVGNLANYHGQQAGDSIRLDLPDKLDREAMPFVIEAGGDKKKMTAMVQKIAASKDPKMAAKFDPIVDHAINNFDRLDKARANHDKMMAESVKELKANGIDIGEVENYVSRKLDAPEEKEAMLPNPLFGGSGGGGGNPKYFTKGRVFDTLADAIGAGYRPKSTDLADLDAHRIEAAKKIIGQKQLFDELKQTKSPTDGEPIIGQMEQVKKLNGKTEAQVPRGYTVVQAGGQPLVIHNDFASIFKNLFGSSAIRTNAAGRALIKAAAVVKHGTLAVDTFHIGRMLFKMGTAGGGGPLTIRNGHPAWNIHKGRALLEYTDADLGRAQAMGDITKKEADYARANRPKVEKLMEKGMNVGKVADNLMEQAKLHLPIVSKLNSWIFGKLSRSAMLQASLVNLDRNLKNSYYTEDQAYRQTAKEMNELFGNLQNQGILQNKTLQDISRLIFLAPNWTESQFRNEARAYAQAAKAPINAVRGRGFRVGNSARVFAAGFVALLAANQIFNYLSRGHSTFENKEKDRKLDAHINGGKRGFWFSALEIAGEYAHAAHKYLSQRENPVDVVTHIAQNKLSPMARGAKELLTGRDAQGKHFLNNTDRVRGAIVDSIPVPMFTQPWIERDPRQPFGFRTTRAPAALEKQSLQAVGMKVTAAQSARSQMFAIAQPFRADRQQNDAAGEYTELRRALDNDDDKSAKSEIKWLYDRGKTFDQIREAVGVDKKGIIQPENFAGSKAREEAMIPKLKPDEKSIYSEAQKEHTENAARLMRIIGSVPSPSSTAAAKLPRGVKPYDFH